MIGAPDASRRGSYEYFAGFVRLKNGNFVIANWLGFLALPGDRPHLIELTPDNQLVWQWGGPTEARAVNGVYVVR